MVAGCVVAVLAACTTSAPEPTSTRTFEGQPVLEPWAEALRGSGDEAARIVVLGDSVSEGSGIGDHLENRWIGRLERGLRERVGAPGCPTSAGGYHGTTSVVPADYRAETLPDPVTQGEVTPLAEVGPGGRAVQLGPGASITWRVDARSVDVGYRTRPDGGAFRVTVDGETTAPASAIPTRLAEPEVAADETPDAGSAPGSAVGARTVWSSGGLGPGEHTVTVTSTSEGEDAPVTITDLTPYRGDRDRCVHVLDAARAGVEARTIARTPTDLADSLSLDPDLLLVPLGFNDARRGVGPAEFGRVLDSLIEQTRETGYEGPILLVGWFTPDWGDELPPWGRYLDQMAGRTDHDAVSFIDLSAVLPPVATAPGGVYLDRLHPGPRGQVLIARSLLEVLGAQADVDQGATSS